MEISLVLAIIIINLVTGISLLGNSLEVNAQSATESAMEEARAILSAAANATANATGEVMTESSGETIQVKAILKTGDYITTNLHFQNATITFGSGNDICPDNNCIMEFQDTTFNEFGQDRILSGTLKVEDKANSTGDFKSFVYYKLSGSFQLSRSMENPKTGESILFYEGDLGIDKNEAIFNPQFKYESTVKLTGNSFELNGHA